MSVRDIQAQLEEFYGTEVSPTLISKITDKVLDGINQWQMRPLEDVYAVVFMDAIHYKVRVDAKVVCKAAYTCLGVNLQGQTDVLGIWLSENEGAYLTYIPVGRAAAPGLCGHYGVDDKEKNQSSKKTDSFPSVA
ncbi:MAG: transposase [Bdellovibrio sp.]|jgi:putative transposase